MTRADLERLVADLAKGFADAGRPIGRPVRVEVRLDLPPAATTFRRGDGFVVLVSDRAVGDRDLPMLLAHELGHVQRMASGHASHDDDAIAAAYASVQDRLTRDWQWTKLHHAINLTQDLYADPLSLAVARRLGLVRPEAIDDLVALFAIGEPAAIDDPLERRWDRTEDVVGNERAVALARLAGAAKAAEAARDAQRRYLAAIEPDLAAAAPWFEARFADLPEDVSRDGFRRLLVEYAGRFVATANGVSPPSEA